MLTVKKRKKAQQKHAFSGQDQEKGRLAREKMFGQSLSKPDKYHSKNSDLPPAMPANIEWASY